MTNVTIRVDPRASASTSPVPIPSWMYGTRRQRRALTRRGPRRFRKQTMQALLRMRFGGVLGTVRISDLEKAVRIL